MTAWVSTPFCAPCGRGGKFPPLWPERPGNPSLTQSALEAINTALAHFGGTPVSDLPSAVVPAANLCVGFSELDPYAAVRTEPILPPLIEQCTGSTSQGREVAVFLSPQLKNAPVVVAALLKLERQVHIDERGLKDEPRIFYEKSGVCISPRLIDAESMARSAAVLLSHGGFHTIARGLIAGIPQVVIAVEGEKMLLGKALERLGVGIMLTRAQLTVPALREAINQVAEDPAFGERARSLAPEFQRRHGAVQSIEIIADRIVAAMV